MRKKHTGLKILFAVVALFALWIWLGSKFDYIKSTSDRPEATDPLAEREVKNLPPDDARVTLYLDIYPMRTDLYSAEGYPIFEFYCHAESTICFDGSDSPFSSFEEATHALPPIRPESVESGKAECTLGLCYDQQHRLIGSDPKNFRD